jgi:MobA/MobL family.
MNKFAEKGLSCRIDHRSNEDRGLDEIPQVHEGSAVRRMEKRGIKTYKGSWNRWVKKTNDNICKLLNAIRDLVGWIEEAKERVHRIENPTISNMVMTYYEHRDEVAEGYKRGTQKSKERKSSVCLQGSGIYRAE